MNFPALVTHLVLGRLLLNSGAVRAQGPIEFQRDIRPILSDKCFRCHGPDGTHREANLRLDLASATVNSAIIPGNPEGSKIIERITSGDPEIRMPPAASGKSLTDDEIRMLRRWIGEGAEYSAHWAFVTPVSD